MAGTSGCDLTLQPERDQTGRVPNSLAAASGRVDGFMPRSTTRTGADAHHERVGQQVAHVTGARHVTAATFAVPGSSASDDPPCTDVRSRRSRALTPASRRSFDGRRIGRRPRSAWLAHRQAITRTVERHGHDRRAVLVDLAAVRTTIWRYLRHDRDVPAGERARANVRRGHRPSWRPPGRRARLRSPGCDRSGSGVAPVAERSESGFAAARHEIPRDRAGRATGPLPDMTLTIIRASTRNGGERETRHRHAQRRVQQRAGSVSSGVRRQASGVTYT